MKTLVPALAIAISAFTFGAGCAHGAASADPLVLRAHFAGTTALLADPGAKKLKELWTLPSSASFRNEIVDRVSQLPPHYFGVKTTNGAALVRPLLEDVLAQESFLEFRATPEFVIAAKLSDARAKVWDENLRQLAGAWKFARPTALNADGFNGWEIKRSEAPQVLRVGRVGAWTVVTTGPEKLPLGTEVINKLRTGGKLSTQPVSASGAWLAGDLNVAQLRGWLPVLANLDNLPTAHFALSNRAEYVRTFATLDFAKPHGWKPEPWLVPTNNIYDPVSSFLVLRGIAPIFESIPTLRKIGWSPTPNQLTGWSMRDVPFQFCYATPSRDVSNQLKRVAPAVQKAVFGEHPKLTGSFSQSTNSPELFWVGLPMATPTLSVLRKNPNFLSFEMFPTPVMRTLAPRELFEQLSREKLVMYDWEITQDRIPNWRQYYQLTEITTGRALTSFESPAGKWARDIQTRVGETVTEVTATSPTQMTLVRKSHLGLNAFEIMTLSRWMESVSFPRFGTFLPEPRNSRPARSAQPARK